MPAWILLLLVLGGALFALKLLYLIATVWALPVTKGALFIPTSSIRIHACPLEKAKPWDETLC